MSQQFQTQAPKSEGPDPRWTLLYKIAGWATVIMVLLIPVQIIIYMIWPTPESAIEAYRIFEKGTLFGLLALELPYLVSNLLSIPVFLAFYTSLRRTNESLMVVATVLGITAVAVVFAARPTFDMLYLSNRYAAATTEAQRAIYLAAGEAKIALMSGTVQQMHYVVGSFALLLISVAMLRSGVFSQTTAYLGVVANVLVFGLYIPVIGIYLSILSVFPFYALWLVLVGRRFFQMGHSGIKAQVPDQMPGILELTRAEES